MDLRSSNLLVFWKILVICISWKCNSIYIYLPLLIPIYLILNTIYLLSHLRLHAIQHIYVYICIYIYISSYPCSSISDIEYNSTIVSFATTCRTNILWGRQCVSYRFERFAWSSTAPSVCELGSVNVCVVKVEWKNVYVGIINAQFCSVHMHTNIHSRVMCLLRKTAGCACAGNVFPATDFNGNRQLASPACITA